MQRSTFIFTSFQGLFLQQQTLITGEKHVACCRATGPHLNFNLAKGGRQ